MEGYGIGRVLDFTKVSKLALPFYHSKHKIQFDNYPVPIELLLRRLKNGESNNGLNWTYNESSPEIRTDLYSPQSEIDEKAREIAVAAQKDAAQKATLAAKKARQREEEENDYIPWFDYGGWVDSDKVSADKLLQQDAYRRGYGSSEEASGGRHRRGGNSSELRIRMLPIFYCMQTEGYIHIQGDISAISILR